MSRRRITARRSGDQARIDAEWRASLADVRAMGLGRRVFDVLVVSGRSRIHRAGDVVGSARLPEVVRRQFVAQFGCAPDGVQIARHIGLAVAYGQAGERVEVRQLNDR